MAQAQTPSPLASAGDEVLLRISATGVQIYECRAAAQGGREWVFKEPRADLFVGTQRIGRHFAGPTWEHAAGSRIVGKAAASLAAPNPGDIPWLRLTVVSRSGAGAFGAVTAVQRIDTHGGVVSGPCPEAGTVLEAPYMAEYVMLRAAP